MLAGSSTFQLLIDAVGGDSAIEAPAERPHTRLEGGAGRNSAGASSSWSYVFMIFRPALRLLTGPLPPLRLAARALAAVILPPLLFFM